MPSTYAYRMNARMNNLRFRKINDITENCFTYELATNRKFKKEYLSLNYRPVHHLIS